MTIPEVVVATFLEHIPRLMTVHGVPGVSAALVAGREIAWHAAYGVKDAATGEPVGGDTVFEAASLSKPVFAYAVLALCEQGALDLDAPLAGYFPGLYTADGFDPDDPRLRRVTAQQVLAHSAGFGNWQTDRVGRLVGEPGERWFYGGEGYHYLQRVVEHLTGTPLGPYMRERVLQPLGMAQSSYTWRARYEAQASRGHGRRGGAGSRAPDAIAAYSLYATAADFARFVLPVTRGAALLGAPLLDEMSTPQIAVGERLSWGLGWGLAEANDGRCFWHWGDLGDVQHYAMGSRPQRWGVVIMTNSDHGLALCADLAEAALGEAYAAPVRTVLRLAW